MLKLTSLESAKSGRSDALGSFTAGDIFARALVAATCEPDEGRKESARRLLGKEENEKEGRTNDHCVRNDFGSSEDGSPTQARIKKSVLEEERRASAEEECKSQDRELEELTLHSAIT